MLILKGSYKGVKKCNEMKNFDITHSTIKCLGKKCYQPEKVMIHLKNQVSIKKNENKDTYYIYHSYDAIDNNKKIYYSGRWYDTSFEFDKNSINNKDKTIRKKMIFEDYSGDTLKKYKAEIKIYFNERGWKKINSLIK